MYMKQASSYYENSEGEVFWGKQGAGVLCIAENTGRILLLKRSSEVQEPGTWGIPGGASEGKQSPIVTAKKELREETRYKGPIELHKSFVYRSGGFQFHNFIGYVPKEFRPVLDWENDRWGWFSFDKLPSPLHFGVKALLQRGDMRKNRKIARWVGEKNIPFDVGRLTHRHIDNMQKGLEISEFTFQKAMGRYARKMGGTYHDGIITIPHTDPSKKPYIICVHYLKYNDMRWDAQGKQWYAVPSVAWMVYPKSKKNKSKMFKVFESPIQGSGQVWRKFCNWMDTIVRYVSIRREVF